MKNLKYDHEGNNNEMNVENGTQNLAQDTKKYIWTWNAADINTTPLWVIVFSEIVQPVQCLVLQVFVCLFFKYKNVMRMNVAPSLQAVS